ncbi:MAG: DUF420 domain-containing protein [Verrucomicrobia bacterium]|nr:DUF420 domain-containing protein [Verrucomicrobiota bacterium]MCH8513277.1 DUF420 domain-containing protein [Kiritimatiellia bacterium]
MTPIPFLPTLNALLNLTAVFFLVRGRQSVKKGNVTAHWRNMTLALCVSALFLSSYLYYHYLVGSVRYEGNAFFRGVYFLVLIPHIILAVAQVPFIVAAVVTALRQKFTTHVRIVRILWPVWIYVSVTGVIVYLMLYVLPHGPVG